MTDKNDARRTQLIAKGYIHFQAILEIVGKPKDHVTEAFKSHLATIGKNIKFDIQSETVHEAIEVENSDNLFSSFAELEVMVKNMGVLYDFCFECMPASVQIIEPSRLSLSASDASAALNDFIGRLHQVDMHSKKLTQTNIILSENVRVAIENAIVIYVSQKPKQLAAIGNAVGVNQDQLAPFLKHLVTAGKIVESEPGTYAIAHASIKKNADVSNEAVFKEPKSKAKKSKK